MRLDHTSEDASVGAVPRLVPQLHSKVNALTMSEDGVVVATVGDDGLDLAVGSGVNRGIFRRVDTGRRIIQVPADNALALSPDGRQVMAPSSEQFGIPMAVGVWDVASGELLQRVYDEPNNLLAFLDGQAQALMCSVARCRVQPLPLYSGEAGTILPTEFGPQLAGRMVLSTDESYVALPLHRVKLDSAGEAVASEASVGWMELNINGAQRVITIPGDHWVGAVAALDGARVVAGLFSGDVLLIDGAAGRIVGGMPGYQTETGVFSAVPLDERRFVVGGLLVDWSESGDRWRSWHDNHVVEGSLSVGAHLRRRTV